MVWQPIETAPDIGVYLVGNSDHIWICHASMKSLIVEIDNWLDDGEDRTYRQPTHWMPLPPRPPKLETMK